MVWRAVTLSPIWRITVAARADEDDALPSRTGRRTRRARRGSRSPGGSPRRRACFAISTMRSHAQVGLARGRRAAAVGLVGEAHVQRVAVDVGVDGDRLDAQLAAGADHAHRDLAAVGDQDLLEHAGSERDVPVLLRRVLVALVRQHLERVDDLRRASPRAGSPRRCSRAPPPCTGSRTSRGTRPRARRRRAAGSAASCSSLRNTMLTAPSGPITAISAVGIGEVHVGADVLAAHDDVGAAVGLARDHRDLRHRRLAEGVEQLGAVRDDAAVLLVDARQEARHVDEGDDRQVEGVAEAHEARRPSSTRRCRGSPRRYAGWFATMPTERPPKRAKPHTMFRAQSACTSRKSPSSTTSLISSLMS